LPSFQPATCGLIRVTTLALPPVTVQTSAGRSGLDSATANRLPSRLAVTSEASPSSAMIGVTCPSRGSMRTNLERVCSNDSATIERPPGAQSAWESSPG